MKRQHHAKYLCKFTHYVVRFTARSQVMVCALVLQRPPYDACTVYAMLRHSTREAFSIYTIPIGSFLPAWKVSDFTRVVPVSELLTNSENKA